MLQILKVTEFVLHLNMRVCPLFATIVESLNMMESNVLWVVKANRKTVNMESG